MKSIRSRLLLTLLPTLMLIWLLSSWAIYLNTRNSLYSGLDQALNLLANDAPFLGGRPKGGNPRRKGILRKRAQIFAEGGEYYFEIRDNQGKIRRRSESLEGQQLEQSIKMTPERRFGLEQLPDGTPIRTVRFLQKHGRNNDRSLSIIVARDAGEVEATLTKLRRTLLLATLTGLATSALVVLWSIRRGLRPLETLSENLAKIGSANLNQRLKTESQPNELKIVPNKINDLLERLEDAFERERRFGSDLAHEIRTPTAEIRALVEVGLSWPEEFGKDELKNILESTKRMETTTQAILDLTRLSNTAEVALEEIALRPLVESLIPEDERISIQGNGILRSHPAFLQIMLQNLISNAVAYAPPNDEILITLASSHFGISNAAPELTEEDLPKLFQRFWRKDKSRTSSQHAGLGLRLVKVCAEKTGNDLSSTLKDHRLKISLQS